MNPAVESEFLQLLPSLLRDGLDGAGVDGGGSLLSKLLLVAQKFLTGVDDDVPNPKRGQSVGDEPIETTIDRIDRLFDPWRAPPEFLPWLASWVNLELREEWSTIQRRKLIAEMVPFARKTGLKVGLHRYLDLYAAREYRPRISIDDGEAVFRLTFGKDGSPQLTTIAFSHLATTPDSRWPILAHPSAVAVLRPDHPNSPGLRYIVAEPGTNLGDDYQEFQRAIRQPGGTIGQPQPGAIWCLLPSGELDPCHFFHDPGSTDGPVIRPLNHQDGGLRVGEMAASGTTPASGAGRASADDPLFNPVAIAIDDRDGSLFVLEQGHQFLSRRTPGRIYRYTLQRGGSDDPVNVSLERETVCSDLKIESDNVATDLLIVPGVGGPSSRRLVILQSNPSRVGDRKPALLLIDHDNQEHTDPVREMPMRRIQLEALVNPTAIAHEQGNDFLLTDCREDEVAAASGYPSDVTLREVRNKLAGQLVRITVLENLNAVQGSPLLRVPHWPSRCLIHPTALACLGPQRYLICDTGVKQYLGHVLVPSNIVRSMAEPAMLYLVDLREDPPQPIPLVERSGLTRPTSMASGLPDEVIIVDRGEHEEMTVNHQADWRTCPHTMGISILFSCDRFPLDNQAGRTADKDRLNAAYENLQRSLRGVKTLIEREKPAHINSVWR